MGNIASQSGTVGTITYTYDAQGQLTKEYKDPSNYTEYTYDTYGNIRSKSVRENGVTTTYNYTYGNSTWLDLLTSYDGGTITYDNLGNPTSYHDGRTFSWIRGRQLASTSKSGVTTSFTYAPAATVSPRPAAV